MAMPDAGLAALDPRSRDLIIRTIIGEVPVRDPVEGQAAVAHVIRNRMMAGRYGGNDAESVIMKKYAFEPWGSETTRERMLSVPAESPRYRAIGGIVDNVFAGQAPDPTGGATHFFAPKAQAALGRSVPRWAGDPTATIGGHQFYAPEGPVLGGQATPQASPPVSAPLAQTQAPAAPANAPAASPGAPRDLSGPGGATAMATPGATAAPFGLGDVEVPPPSPYEQGVTDAQDAYAAQLQQQQQQGFGKLASVFGQQQPEMMQVAPIKYATPAGIARARLMSAIQRSGGY